MLSDEQLAEIDRRAEAATDGPWFVASDRTEILSESACRVIADTRFFQGPPDFLECADAEFIAHARTDVPALIAALREARAERDALREVAELLAHADADALALSLVARERHALYNALVENALVVLRRMTPVSQGQEG